MTRPNDLRGLAEEIGNFGFKPALLRVAADEMEAMQDELAGGEKGWLPIETAPNEDCKIILGTDGTWVGECYWDARQKNWMSLGKPVTLTHWQPLPAPPTKEYP